MLVKRRLVLETIAGNIATRVRRNCARIQNRAPHEAHLHFKATRPAKM